VACHRTVSGLIVAEEREPWPMVVPFVGTPWTEVMEATKPYLPLWAEVSAEFGYWELLKSCWAYSQETGFVVVEHDIIPHDGFGEELMDCEHDWCGFPYLVAGKVQPALGCTKFSAKLVTEHPTLIEGLGPTYWTQLDTMILIALEGRGIHQHVHPTQVFHIHKDAHQMPQDPRFDAALAKLLERGVDPFSL
jgi:hypothetical protein